jgi:hypothetical protein
LQDNFIDDPESLLRKSQSSTASSFATPLTDKSVTPVAFATLVMARNLRDYSVPAVGNMPIGLAINIGAGNFELKTSLITIVKANQFYGLPSEDANAHLQHFLELLLTVVNVNHKPST